MEFFKMTFKAHLKDDDGSMSIEAVLVAPLVLIGVLFTYTYFTAFQVKAAANKAAYTISDYISRQTESVDANFMEGLGDIYGFLTNNDDEAVRVSSVMWIEDDANPEEGEYHLEWSYAVDGDIALTDATLPALEEKLPLMTNGQTVLLVETSTTWSPIFDVGLDILDFEDVVTTKPRFATQVVFDTGGLGSASASESIYDDEEAEADLDP